jgi:hypothetical protein
MINAVPQRTSKMIRRLMFDEGHQFNNHHDNSQMHKTTILG